MPALLTRMSIRPKASTAVATMRPAAAKSVTDSCDGTARPPPASISRQTDGGRVLPLGVAPEADAQVVDDDGGALGGQLEGELRGRSPARPR